MIGVFDSGIGGLTVFKEIGKSLPDYNLAYFGDMARVPYGARTQETITQYSREIVAFLINQGAKIIIVACNSASSNALPALQKEFTSVPILGVIVPAVEKALEITKNKIIGIVGTCATVQSGAYGREIVKRDALVTVRQQSCPLLVPLIEEGWTSNLETRRIVKRYTMSLKHSHIDTLILGCTHYPLIKKAFQGIMGKKVKIIDSAAETAVRLQDYLKRHPRLDSILEKHGGRQFFVTDTASRFSIFAKHLLGPQFKETKQVDLAELESALTAAVALSGGTSPDKKKLASHVF